MLMISVLRATCEDTAQACGSCAVCGSEFELGPDFAWLPIDGGPYELCERCLRGLFEWADSEGLEVPWKDAHTIYEDARQRYTEPMTTSEALMAMPLEEEHRILEEAYLN